MDQPRPPRHHSFVGPIILIVLGALLLIWNVYPGLNPWPILFRFWPLILIVIGLGKIWDSYYVHRHIERGDAYAEPWISGMGIAWILLLIFFVLAMWHGRGRWNEDNWNAPWTWHGRSFSNSAHDTQAVELQGATSADMDLEIPAGELTIAGGSSRLMDAEFRYPPSQGKPNVNYSVSGGRGELRVDQNENSWHTHFGNEDNDWDMRVANEVPLDLHVQMGAGHTSLRLNGVNVKNLDVHMGAGQLDLDLSGERKTSLDGTIEGGVGQATVYLPKDLGVHVDASGGIGSVSARGFKQDGDSYENELYGKTPTSIELTIHGGVGSIRLVSE
jgi:predicted membrane protein